MEERGEKVKYIFLSLSSSRGPMVPNTHAFQPGPSIINLISVSLKTNADALPLPGIF